MNNKLGNYILDTHKPPKIGLPIPLTKPNVRYTI